MVAALPSTTPRPAHKSSTDDLGPPLCQVDEEESHAALWAAQQSSSDRDGVRRLSLPEQKRRPNGIVAMARRDSALEAFRHNPTDGSFAPPADRPSTFLSCPTAVHTKPFSKPVLQGLSGVFATTTKICTPRGSSRVHTRSDLPTRSVFRASRASSDRTAGYK